jgi:NAD(P)-dependent dehydrogenase (short-subunit alcohol dehydrogenase family)
MKTVVITGAARGVGLYTAEKFVLNGHRVFGLDILDKPSLEKDQYVFDALFKEGTLNQFVKCDITDRTSVLKTVNMFVNQFTAKSTRGGKLDILINNAGVCRYGSIWDIELSDINEMVAVNFVGLIHVTKTFLPYMANGTLVINVASGSAIYGLPNNSVYAATKRGVMSLTESWNIELEKRGIYVCDIKFPNVDTLMIDHSHPISNNLGIDLTPEQAANSVYKLSKHRKIHSNATIKLDFLEFLSKRFPKITRSIARSVGLYENEM